MQQKGINKKSEYLNHRLNRKIPIDRKKGEKDETHGHDFMLIEQLLFDLDVKQKKKRRKNVSHLILFPREKYFDIQ